MGGKSFLVHSMPPIVRKTPEMEWCISGGTHLHAHVTHINKTKRKDSRAVATGSTTNIQLTRGARQLLTALLG